MVLPQTKVLALSVSMRVMDGAASEPQAGALGRVLGGELGGPPAMLGPLIGDIAGIEQAPVEWRQSDGTLLLYKGNGRGGFDAPLEPLFPCALTPGLLFVDENLHRDHDARRTARPIRQLSAIECRAILAQADLLQVDAAILAAAEIVRAIGVERIALLAASGGEGDICLAVEEQRHGFTRRQRQLL